MRIGALIEKRATPFFSLEFFPPADDAQLPSFFETVESLKSLNPLFASITYGAGGSKQDRTVIVASELAKRGLTTMVHLTCVGADPGRIENFLDQLADAGIENVLALRGDAPRDREWDWSAGHFRYASDLVSFIRKVRPSFSLGVAAYPTPHPESVSYAEDRAFTARKMLSGADFAVTQLFFDVREYAALVSDLRARGVTAPVIPGVLTIRSFASFKRVLSLSGASIPAKLWLSLEEADKKGGEAAVREAGLAFAALQIRQLLDCGAPGIHLYTLNKADLCLEIAKNVKLS